MHANVCGGLCVTVGVVGEKAIEECGLNRLSKNLCV